MPVSLAENGLGEAGFVPIPSDIWADLVHPEYLMAMSLVQIPQKTLSRELKAVTRALVQQGHLHVLSLDMRGGGGSPARLCFLFRKRPKNALS